MQRQWFAVSVVTAGSALGAALANGAGTRHAFVDLLLRVGIAVAVTLGGARARPWSLVVASALAVVCSTNDASIFVLSLLVFAAAVVVGTTDRAEPLLGAIVGAGAVQVLLRLPTFHPANLTAFAAAIGFSAIVVSGYRNSSTRARRLARRVGVGVGVALGLALLLFATELVLAQTRLRHGIDAARAGIESARLGRTAIALRQFDAAQHDLASARDQLDSPLSLPVRIVPVVAQNERALRSLVDNAEALVATGSRAAREADIQSLRVRDGRLDPARVAKMRAPLLNV